jgi:polo-like kinase 1
MVDKKTLEHYAAKIFTKKSLKKSRAKKNLISEIQIHKSLDHKNIVKFMHYFENSENVYVLLELCSNQTLNDLVKRRGHLQEIEAKYFILQIVDALEYLHKKK